jgi:TonB family protein
MAYRVPRRFIVPPDDPPPYGLLALSFAGHALCFLMAGILSAYVNAQVAQSKIYIVNLVPTAPALGTPEPQAAPPAPPAPKAPERTPPRPLEAPRPKETPPPKAEAPPPKETPPPKAETPPPRPRPVDEVPPPREVVRATPPRPAELALPKRAEKETPALDNPATRERLVERALPPPPTPAAPPTRSPTPEPSRIAAPQPPPPPVPTAAVATRPVEPMRLGRPDAVTVPTTGSISLDVSDFPFTYYLRQLQAKISERWAPPRASVAGGERVVVLFEIGRDGQIKEPAVEKSSGNALYDQSALRAVTEAGPFPPLPPEFKAPSLKVHFGFEFKPDQG